MSASSPSSSPLESHRSPVAGTSRRPGRATAALVVGILSVITAIAIALVGLVLGIVAVVLGATTRSRIRREGLDGAGRAQAGLIIGVVGIVIAAALMAVAVIQAS